MYKITSKITVILYWSICLLLAFYIVKRAIVLSFTHDESLSYAILHGAYSIFSQSNTHLLNSLLMRVSEFLFGNSEFALRLPNILAFGLSVYSIWKITLLLKYKWLGLVGFSFILFNPSILEFYSLARGYGLSFGFCLLSISFLVKAHSTNDLSNFQQHIRFSIIAAIASCYSHLGLVNFFIALFISSIFLLFKKGDLINNYNKRTLLYTFIAAAPVLWFLLRLQNKNQLYFGVDNFQDTWLSIINSSFYQIPKSNSTIEVISIIVVTIFFLGVVSLIVKKSIKNSFFHLNLVIALMAIGIGIEHSLFGAKFPVNRTALFLIIFVGIYFTLAFNFWVKNFPLFKIPSILISITYSFILGFGLAKNYQFKYAKDWQYDQFTKQTIELVKKKIGNNTKVSISNNWLFEPTINYYIKQKDLNMEAANRNGINDKSDFIYALSTDSIPENYTLIKTFERSSSRLYINNSYHTN